MDSTEIVNTQKILTEKELINIVEKFLVVADREGIRVSMPNFAKYTKENYGYSKKNAINRRFASNSEKTDGWRNLLVKLGRVPMKRWTTDEIIDFYHKTYLDLGEKEPTVKDIEKAGLSGSTVLNYFRNKNLNIPNETNHGGHYKAIYLMYQKYGIEKKIKIPEYNVKPPRFVGEELSKYGLDITKLGLEFGPVNEQGVVALFSKIHRFIGFPKIKYINDFFPDCEATCNLGANDHWVNIEFKYSLRKTHIAKQDLIKWKTKVDYLVCWINDNKALTERIKPIKVISIKDLLNEKSVIEKINDK